MCRSQLRRVHFSRRRLRGLIRRSLIRRLWLRRLIAGARLGWLSGRLLSRVVLRCHVTDERISVFFNDWFGQWSFEEKLPACLIRCFKHTFGPLFDFGLSRCSVRKHRIVRGLMQVRRRKAEGIFMASMISYRIRVENQGRVRS